jgi:aminomethyltransferase
MDDRRSPLAAAHEAAGADFTDFGGWAMPVSFDSIRAEHAAVREAVGKFDVSHMSQLAVSGSDGGALCNRLVTNDVAALDPGEAAYAAVTTEDGTMLDDVLAYDLPDDHPTDYLVVPNAGHDDEMTARWRDHCERWEMDATVDNETTEYGMIAVQGPDAPDLLGDLTDVPLRDLDRFEVAMGTVAGVDCLVARTGYTGEKGFEVLCPWDEAEPVWDALDCQPCGLGARDTLRLEMGFLLSGQDFDPAGNPHTPYEADIGFAVDPSGEYVGSDALAAATDPDERLQGVRLTERGVPREGYPVTTPDGERLGTVTSGTMSPTLGEGIALAYLPAELEPGTEVAVEIRGEGKEGRVRATPFIDR